MLSVLQSEREPRGSRDCRYIYHKDKHQSIIARYASIRFVSIEYEHHELRFLVKRFIPIRLIVRRAAHVVAKLRQLMVHAAPSPALIA